MVPLRSIFLVTQHRRGYHVSSRSSAHPVGIAVWFHRIISYRHVSLPMFLTANQYTYASAGPQRRRFSVQPSWPLGRFIGVLYFLPSEYVCGVLSTRDFYVQLFLAQKNGQYIDMDNFPSLQTSEKFYPTKS